MKYLAGFKMVNNIVVGICPVCRRNVNFLDEHYIDMGLDYHESCYLKHLCIVKNKLETKQSKGNITLDEVKYLDDVNKIIINISSESKSQQLKYKNNIKYDNLICKPEIREDFLHSNLEKKMKLLEESRKIEDIKQLTEGD